MTLQQLLDSYGDSRATEAQQSAVANYEKKYGLKDGAKVDDGGAPKPEPEQKGGDDDVPAWAKALVESNKALTERLNKMDGERTTQTRKQQLDKIIESLPETLRKAYGRTPVGTMSDEEFASLKDEIAAEVSAIEAESKSQGAVFGRPPRKPGTETNPKAASDAEVDAVVERLGI